MSQFKRSVISTSLSLVLHLGLLIFALLLHSGKYKGSGHKSPNPSSPQKASKANPFHGIDAKKVLERQVTEVEIVSPPREKGPGIKLKKRKPKLQAKKLPVIKDCPGNWYGGLGLEMDGFRVMRVYAGYAADKAGIKVDDLIEWTSDNEILGKPGTELTLRIRRGAEVLTIFAVREKICY
jgi:hypothetical protein